MACGIWRNGIFVPSGEYEAENRILARIHEQAIMKGCENFRRYMDHYTLFGPVLFDADGQPIYKEVEVSSTPFRIPMEHPTPSATISGLTAAY